MLLFLVTQELGQPYPPPSSRYPLEKNGDQISCIPTELFVIFSVPADGSIKQTAMISIHILYNSTYLKH
jgi:hypothetical protein